MVSKVSLKPPIENVLSSKGRVRILKILVEVGELNITEIARRAGLNYSAANHHITALREMGLVEEKTFGKIRILSLKLEDKRVQAIRSLIDLWCTSADR